MTARFRLRTYCLPLTESHLIGYGRALGLTTPDLPQAISSMAGAIAASPAWEVAPDVALIVRRQPPLIAVLGRFDDGEEAWLEAQARTLAADCTRLRYVDYSRVEEQCERLGELLLAQLGRDGLRDARFVAIPRGGHVVLGLLALVLDLAPRQLEPAAESEGPLVVVDDCALSGTRFQSYVESLTARELVFAHLYSSPELRELLVASDARIQAVLAASDLETARTPDVGREARFLRHMQGAHRAVPSEPLAFPWGEPDRMIWHPREERPVAAWRLMPPELCLKNRSTRIPVQVQPTYHGELRPTDQVLVGELEGQIVLHRLADGESAALDAVASELWRALTKCRDQATAVDELRQVFPDAGDALADDVEAFAMQLEEQGFLERFPRDTENRGD